MLQNNSGNYIIFSTCVSENCFKLIKNLEDFLAFNIDVPT